MRGRGTHLDQDTAATASTLASSAMAPEASLSPAFGWGSLGGRVAGGGWGRRRVSTQTAGDDDGGVAEAADPAVAASEAGAA